MPAAYDPEERMAIFAPLGNEMPFRLMWFSGREEISRLYKFHLELRVENKLAMDVENNLDQLLGEPVMVELPVHDGDIRFFNGICASISRGGRDDHTTSFTMLMVPKIWLYTQNRDCRIFQRQSVLDIIEDIAASIGVEIERPKSKTEYRRRDYCVQYNESDFEFISRLMEVEGIFYHFQHSDSGREKMVLMDSSAHCTAIREPSSINYGGNLQNGFADMRILRWRKTQMLTAANQILRDYTMHAPGNHWQIERPILDPVDAGGVNHKMIMRSNEHLEVYEYPGGFAHRYDGVEGVSEDQERLVDVRADQTSLPGLEIQGASSCRHFMPAHSFTNIDLQDLHAADGDYVLTWVDHVARPQIVESKVPKGIDYRNSFGCIPIGHHLRPVRKTRKPKIYGVQTAVVLGPETEGQTEPEEIHVDEFGRVKVKFHWDRTLEDDAWFSAWLRVGQGWAGNRYGMHFWPRVGDEVIVAFEDGNPDKPIIVGSVYNRDNMPPYKLPDEKTKSGIKTKSTKDGDVHKHYNELRFEDKKGSEQIYLHAENNFDAVIESSETRLIGSKRLTKIGRKEDQKKSEFLDYKWVFGKCSTVAAGDYNVTSWENLNTWAHKKHDIAGAGNIEIYSYESVIVEGKTAIELKVGSNSIRIDQFGVWIDALNVGIKGQLMATMDAPISSVTADGVTTVNAPLTNVLSTGPLILKGAMATVTY